MPTNIKIIFLTNKLNIKYLKIIFKKNTGIGAQQKKEKRTVSRQNFINKKKLDLKIKKKKKIVSF